MIVVDEYIAARVVGGDWPADLPDDEIGLPASRHWRLLQTLHGGRGGQLTQILDPLSPAARDGIRDPHPEVLHVLDPLPLLDDAAILAARFGGTGLLTAEALAAGLAHGSCGSASPPMLAASWPGPPPSWGSPSTSRADPFPLQPTAATDPQTSLTVRKAPRVGR